jgi:hypothetical protein
MSTYHNTLSTFTYSVDEAIDTANVATAAIIITVHLYDFFQVMGFSWSAGSQSTR